MRGFLQEHTLFSIVKQWSKGQDHGFHSAETEQQILRLVREIRLEHIGPENLNKILDDPWLQKVSPSSSSFLLKGLVIQREREG